MKVMKSIYAGQRKRRRGCHSGLCGASPSKSACSIGEEIGIESASVAIRLCKEHRIRCSYRALIDVALDRARFMLAKRLHGKWVLSKSSTLRKQEKCAKEAIRDHLWSHKYIKDERS